MKKILLVFSALIFLLLPFAALLAQSPDTAFVQAAADLYQPKVNKAGVAISATAPLPLFRKADNKMKWIEENAAKNTVVSISSILFATGNTPYAGKFVRENGGSVITCFIDKIGVKHEINKKYLPSVGNSGVQVDANNPTSDFLGAFVKEEGKAYITAYVDVYGTRHAVGVDATTFATKSALVDSSTALRNKINYVSGQVATNKDNIDRRADSIVTKLNNDFRMVGSNAKGASTALSSITTGSNNVALGDSSLYAATTSSSNVAIGGKTLRHSTASNNVAIGLLSLYAATTSSFNVGIGANTLSSTTTGGFNLAIGNNSFQKNTTGQTNVGVGVATGQRADGNNNVAIGYNALTGTGSATITGVVGNTAIGMATMKNYNTGTYYNTVVGYGAIENVNGGSFNTALGVYALQTGGNGGHNTALGVSSLRNTTGGYNVAIGDSSLIQNTSGSYNIAIGYNTNNISASASNQLNIGNWIKADNGKVSMPYIPIYVDDAAADADTTLVSGSFYRITGSRVVYQKP